MGLVTVGDLRRMLKADTGLGRDDMEALVAFAGLVERTIEAGKKCLEGSPEGFRPLFGELLDRNAPGAADVGAYLREIPSIGRNVCGLARFALDELRLGNGGRGAVIAADAMSARGMMPRRMVLMGVSEGSFPRASGEGGLFGYELRGFLNGLFKKQGVRFSTRHDMLLEDRLLFALLVSSAKEGVVTFSRGSRGGGLSRMAAEYFGGMEIEGAPPAVVNADGAPVAVRQGYGDFLRGMSGRGFTGAEGKASGGVRPTPKTVSASAVEDYLECPYYWLLKNVLDIPESFGMPSVETLPRDAWGKAVHEAVTAVFGIKGLLEMSPAAALAKARNAAEKSLAALAAKGLVRTGSIWEDMKQRTAAQIGQYAASVVLRGGKRDIELEYPCKLPVAGGGDAAFVISVRMDFVEKRKDSILVVDFKTSSPDKKDQYREQLAIYRQAVAQKERMDAAAVLTQLVFFSMPLTENAEIREVKLPAPEAVMEGLQLVADGIRGGMFARYPEDGNTCAHCSMYPVCLVSAKHLAKLRSGDAGATLIDKARESFRAQRR